VIHENPGPEKNKKSLRGVSTPQREVQEGGAEKGLFTYFKCS